MSKTYPYRYDNCKNCVARCPNAGKDRKFVYHGFKSCKVIKQSIHIDRSAWEPCGWCGTCVNCVYETDREENEPCSSCLGSTKGIIPNYKPAGFCKYCGRPLTDAAWEMLEKRFGDLETKGNEV